MAPPISKIPSKYPPISSRASFNAPCNAPRTLLINAFTNFSAAHIGPAANLLRRAAMKSPINPGSSSIVIWKMQNMISRIFAIIESAKSFATSPKITSSALESNFLISLSVQFLTLCMSVLNTAAIFSIILLICPAKSYTLLTLPRTYVA